MGLDAYWNYIFTNLNNLVFYPQIYLLMDFIIASKSYDVFKFYNFLKYVNFSRLPLLNLMF